MNNAITNQIEKLKGYTHNATTQEIKHITIQEFKRTPYEQTKINYLAFMENITKTDINNLLMILREF